DLAQVIEERILPVVLEPGRRLRDIEPATAGIVFSHRRLLERTVRQTEKLETLELCSTSARAGRNRDGRRPAPWPRRPRPAPPVERGARRWAGGRPGRPASTALRRGSRRRGRAPASPPCRGGS